MTLVTQICGQKLAKVLSEPSLSSLCGPVDVYMYRILPGVNAAVCNVHPCFWPKLAGKQKSFILIQFFIYLETEPIIIFQGIILHTDIVTAF